MIQDQITFNHWMDSQLDVEIPTEIIAFNINIYESPFKIELVGSKEFDTEDEDWACNENWIPKDRVISVSNVLFGKCWETAQGTLLQLAQNYLQSGCKNAHKLKHAKAFAIGFVDGNLNYVR
ncbi:hypothetical protein [Alteromonas lipotrueae]|uniref:hypothetical protein n=1 Tax=Alteromonas lipotrueae TaxID=2803814 RepID=UPI001C494E78|nr:hypothetical protein [Alteromonas lipotrueae]